MDNEPATKCLMSINRVTLKNQGISCLNFHYWKQCLFENGSQTINGLKDRHYKSAQLYSSNKLHFPHYRTYSYSNTEKLENAERLKMERERTFCVSTSKSLYFGVLPPNLFPIYIYFSVLWCNIWSQRRNLNK